MKLLVVRVERFLKSSLSELAKATGRTLSEVARDLIIVGVDIQLSGGVKIVGPLGIERSFAKLGYEGKRGTKLAIWVEDQLIEELETLGDNLRGVLRETLHVGLLRLRPCDIEFRGPFGVIRPFATADFPEGSERAKEALKRLQRSTRSQE